VEEVTGGGGAGVALLWGDSDETDWACAGAATPANNPRLTTVDFSKLDILETSFPHLEYVSTYARLPCMKW
jgi:hypothetical protein